MNQPDRQLVAARIFACAVYYGKEIKREEVSAFIDVLVKQFNTSAEVLISAFDQYEKDSKNRFFPAPVHLRQFIEPEVSTEDVSTQLAADIVRAIRSHGVEWSNGYLNAEIGRYYRTRSNHCFYTWDEAVKHELGELGLEVVKRFSWRSLVDLYDGGRNLVAFNSQVKQYITSTQNVLKSGKTATLYALPTPAKDTRKQISNGEIRNGIQVFTRPENGEGFEND